MPDVKAVTNLHDSKREQAAKKAPAKKAAPKKDASSNGGRAVVPGLRMKWTLDGERDAKNRVAQHAVTDAGDTYRVTGQDDEWTAVFLTKAGKETVLAEKVGHTAAYQACTTHRKEHFKPTA